MLVGIVVCVLAMRSASLLAMSRMFVRYSQATGNSWTAQRAIAMTPSDADTYRTRAAVSVAQAPAGAVADLERAVSLRPADYSLWMDLGLARDQNGDAAGALAAFDQAVARAPYYAMPHWQRGNLLLRMGQYDAAFNDLNQAAESNPELIPAFIDLSWSLAKSDAKVTAQLVRVNTKSGHTALARFFASHGKPEEALQQLDAAGVVADDIRGELVERLIQKESFKEAYKVWSSGRSIENTPIFDGGFETSLSFDQGGFNWRIPRQLQAVSISLDSTEPHSGAKNLRIEFAGDSVPGNNLAAQLVIVEPSRHYQLNFAARSEDIVSGGLPVVVVTDAAGERKIVGKSAPISRGTTGWTSMTFDFTTQPTTSGIVLGIQRQSCTTGPCPIFGAASFDSFSLVPVK